MRIAGIEKLSLVNGDGCRLVVFMQGCAHHCPGCQNPDTWDFAGGADIDEITLSKAIRDELVRHPLDGITLSGGDPYYQHTAAAKLLLLLSGVDCWVYTGFEWEEIKDKLLSRLASRVVCGPYREDLRCEGKPYGSSNQYIIDTKTGGIVG